MATFRKRKGKWQARIQRASGTFQAKTFLNLKDARFWARKVERDIDLGIQDIKPVLVFQIKLCTSSFLLKIKNFH